MKKKSAPSRTAQAPAPEKTAGLWTLRFKVNNRKVTAKIDPAVTLLDFLRLELQLTGTKGACLEGECGSCYVLLDGRPINACMVLAPQVQGREVTTIEGLASGESLDLIQQSFIECGAVQCGYCTPGLIMAAKALLTHDPRPTREQFLVGMEGNLCRCTGYNKIMRALEVAADAITK
jgi:carbon-monoxide dehydrogenase small subunit